MKRRVLITAGAGGIGRAMGEAFDAAGFGVWVSDVDEAALAACPDSWETRRTDVSDEAAVEALFAEVAGKWGGLSAMVVGCFDDEKRLRALLAKTRAPTRVQVRVQPREAGYLVVPRRRRVLHFGVEGFRYAQQARPPAPRLRRCLSRLSRSISSAAPPPLSFLFLFLLPLLLLPLFSLLLEKVPFFCYNALQHDTTLRPRESRHNVPFIVVVVVGEAAAAFGSRGSRCRLECSCSCRARRSF